MTPGIVFTSDITAKLIKHVGDDDGIAAAARVSTLGELSLDSGHPTANAGLINFLMRDRHGSPFEHASMTFLVEAPIFVFREWMRHRVGWSYNEESGRYRKLMPKFYLPARDRNLVQVGKPGAYAFEPGTDEQHARMVTNMMTAYEDAYGAYLEMLDAGIAREVARMVLPVGLFSSAYVTCNPRSLMAFLSLRTHRADAAFPSFPQREIEMAAEQMEETFSVLFPQTWKAFNDHGRVSP